MSEDDGTVTLGEFEEESSPNQTNSERREMFGIGLLPSDWDVRRLSETSKIIVGNSPPSSTYNESGDGLPFFQGNADFGHFHPAGETYCSEPKKVAEKDDILFSIRAPVGDLNIADQRCCIGRGLSALRSEDQNGLYLFYHLQKRSAWLSRLATGSTFNSVTKGDLENLDIPLPALPEQRKIATVLYDVDRAIRKTEEIIEQTERVRRGMLQDIFRAGIDENGELRRNEDGTEPYKKTKYGTAPESWEIVPLDELVPDDAPIVYGILKPGDNQPDGVPVVKVKDIKNGQIQDDNLLHTAPEIHEKFKRAELEEGDLLFTIRGTVGRMAFVPEHLAGGNITQDTARIRVVNANPNFVRYYFETATPKNYFERNTVGQAVQGINLGKLRKVPVHLPDRAEQDRIVEILDTITRDVEKEREYLDELRRTKKGLMQDLLSGEVRTTDADIDVLEEVKRHG